MKIKGVKHHLELPFYKVRYQTLPIPYQMEQIGLVPDNSQ